MATWLAVSSIIAILTFADLGIGNGLITKISEADGRQDVRATQVLTSSAFAMLCIIAAVLAIALVIVCPHINWGQLLSIKSDAVRAEVPKAIVTLGLITAVAMPVSVVVRVQTGLQQGFQVALWGMAGTLSSLVALVAATRLQTGLVGAFLTDNIVVANRLESEAVAQLAVPAKLFTLVLLPVTLLVSPLWPAYGEARARGDVAWIRRTLMYSTILGVLFTACAGLVAVALGPFIVGHWSRGAVVPALNLLFALAVWSTVLAWGHAAGAFLNGTGQIVAQAICSILMAVEAFALKWLLAERWGISGVIWATTICYVVTDVVPLSIVIRRSLARLAIAGSQAVGT